jgi:hypothetical protein
MSEQLARVLDVTDEAYYADPCDVPSLSQSIATILINQSPKHAWLRHPKLGGVAKKPTVATDAGSIIDDLLLGTGDRLAIIDADDYRTKAAQQARDLARVDGKVPVLRRVYTEAEEIARVLRERLGELGFVFDGQRQVAIEWMEQGEFGPVRCRGKMDHLILEPGRGAIWDLKKIVSAHPRTCARHAIDYGYDVQQAAYTSAVEKLRPDLAGRIDYVILFCEIEEPFAITPARPSGAMRDLGRARWHRAVRTWERCLRENHWPAYVDGVLHLDPPSWALANELGNLEG